MQALINPLSPTTCTCTSEHMYTPYTLSTRIFACPNTHCIRCPWSRAPTWDGVTGDNPTRLHYVHLDHHSHDTHRKTNLMARTDGQHALSARF